MTKTYHFIGIKGSGMSALALMLHQMGHKVQGSDVDKYYFTQRGLEQAGISILPFDEKNIQPDYEIIAGNAFRPDNNVEIAYADANGIGYKRYHEFLGGFMRDFVSLGVAGAHGKTSTTGILSHVLSNITDTSYLIGDGTGRGSANAKYFVFESDEYERHFMPYHPEYSIITNIDFDHPDYFTSLEDVFNAFNDYAKQITKGLFIYGEDEQLRRITSKAPIYYYGFKEEGNDFVAHDLLRSTSGSGFKVSFRGQELGEFQIPSFGRHNIMNATAVIGLLYTAGLDLNLVREHLKTFGGVKRRFTEKIVNETVIIDDFAHHPTAPPSWMSWTRSSPNLVTVAGRSFGMRVVTADLAGPTQTYPSLLPRLGAMTVMIAESSRACLPCACPSRYNCSAAEATGTASPAERAASVTIPMSLTKMSSRLLTSAPPSS